MPSNPRRIRFGEFSPISDSINIVTDDAIMTDEEMEEANDRHIEHLRLAAENERLRQERERSREMQRPITNPDSIATFTTSAQWQPASQLRPRQGAVFSTSGTWSFPAGTVTGVSSPSGGGAGGSITITSTGGGGSGGSGSGAIGASASSPGTAMGNGVALPLSDSTRGIISRMSDDEFFRYMNRVMKTKKKRRIMRHNLPG